VGESLLAGVIALPELADDQPPVEEPLDAGQRAKGSPHLHLERMLRRLTTTFHGAFQPFRAAANPCSSDRFARR
jgi:hypothetical protein